jgi:hypothetical protein
VEKMQIRNFILGGVSPWPRCAARVHSAGAICAWTRRGPELINRRQDRSRNCKLGGVGEMLRVERKRGCFSPTMLGRIIRRIAAIAFRKDFEYAEFQGALVALGWGFWIFALHPFDQYQAGVYRLLAKQLPDAVWGGLFLVLGALQLYGLVFERWGIRRVVSMLAFVAWFYLFLAFLFSAPHILATPTTAMFAVGAAWGHLRISQMRPAKTP